MSHQPASKRQKTTVTSSSSSFKNSESSSSDSSSVTSLVHNKRRIACKARGMPNTHNSHTAYFEISPDCKHGAILVCSHPQCWDSGRRFRYCAVCRQPVAKRNFLKRHAHPDVILPARAAGAEDSDGSGVSKTSGLTDESSYEEELGEQELVWLKLLHERPSLENKQAMNGWMKKVLDLSMKYQKMAEQGQQLQQQQQQQQEDSKLPAIKKFLPAPAQSKLPLPTPAESTLNSEEVKADAAAAAGITAIGNQISL